MNIRCCKVRCCNLPTQKQYWHSLQTMAWFQNWARTALLAQTWCDRRYTGILAIALEQVICSSSVSWIWPWFSTAILEISSCNIQHLVLMVNEPSRFMAMKKEEEKNLYSCICCMFVASWQVSYNKFKPTATLNSINNYGGLVCRLVIFLRVNIWKLRNFVSGLKNESVLIETGLFNKSFCL